LDQEREAKDKAQRTAYGEGGEEKPAVATEEETAATAKEGEKKSDIVFGDIKVEIKRGPAPDKGMSSGIAQRLAKAREEEKLANQQIKAAEEAAAKAGKDTPAYKQAQNIVAKLNAQLRATKLMIQSHQTLSADDTIMRKSTNPDATDFHAIVPINDYPQKARWRVTNKETMSNLIEMTGASVTNKGTSFCLWFQGRRRVLTVVSFSSHRCVLRTGQRAACGRTAKITSIDRVQRRVPGGAGGAGDQAAAHRGISRSARCGGPKPNGNHWAVQCCLNPGYGKSNPLNVLFTCIRGPLNKRCVLEVLKVLLEPYRHQPVSVIRSALSPFFHSTKTTAPRRLHQDMATTRTSALRCAARRLRARFLDGEVLTLWRVPFRFAES